MYDTLFIHCPFAHLLLQHPCIAYFNPTGSILDDFDSVLCADFQVDCVSRLQDIHAARLDPCASHSISVDSFHEIHTARLYPCVAHGISVDLFHKIYLSLRDNPLIPFDAMRIYVVPNLTQ
jgi:hypothetical protein